MTKNITLYYTSDTHGFVFPTNYSSNEQKPMGLLNCVHQFKKDKNTLVLDGGDTIQGSPLSKYLWENRDKEFAITTVMNAGGYDYVTLGNHDFNFGYEGIKKYLGNLNATCVLANVKDKKGELNFVPYVVHTMENGLKVGIAGVVTDYVNLWEKPEHLKHLAVEDAFTAAKDVLETMKPQCDITILIYHGGFECDLKTGKLLAKGKENVGYKICKELDYNLLLTAHQHMPVKGQGLFGTYTLQLVNNAQNFAEINIEYIDGEVKIDSQVVQVGLNHDTALLGEINDVGQEVEAWLDVPVGSFQEEILPLEKLDLALNGSRLAAFYNQVQLEYTGADISCSALGNVPVGFSKIVTIRDILTAYQFANTIVVLEVDKHIIKRALERCAEYYALSEDGVEISNSFLSPKVEHYNFDFFSGISYTIDVRKPIGKRVTRILHNGKPLEDKPYTLAMNDYRATGTGGYEFYQGCKVVKEYCVDIQEIIIEYIRTKKNVTIHANTDFKIIPN